MRTDQLRAFLQSEGIEERSYSIDPGAFDPDESLCLRQEAGSWSVYYSERGLQTGKKIFSSEHEACEYFANAIRSDPTARKGWSSGFSAQSKQ